MYVAESITCPHCNHLASSDHHLFTASLECSNCGDFFLAPISKTFRELKRDEITMSRAAEILGMRFVDVRDAFNAWDAYFYPRDWKERLAAVAWQWKVGVTSLLKEILSSIRVKSSIYLD